MSAGSAPALVAPLPTDHSPSTDAPQRPQPFSVRVLNAGFLFALLLSAIAFVCAAVYLYRYLDVTSSAMDTIMQAPSNPNEQLAIAARLIIARYALLSCGVMTGLAFGFLGFALFLMGANTSMDASATSDKYSLQLMRIAPGTFVLLCAAGLIGVSVTHSVDFDLKNTAPAVSQRDISELKGATATYAPPQATNEHKP